MTFRAVGQDNSEQTVWLKANVMTPGQLVRRGGRRLYAVNMPRYPSIIKVEITRETHEDYIDQLSIFGSVVDDKPSQKLHTIMSEDDHLSYPHLWTSENCPLGIDRRRVAPPHPDFYISVLAEEGDVHFGIRVTTNKVKIALSQEDMRRRTEQQLPPILKKLKQLSNDMIDQRQFLTELEDKQEKIDAKKRAERAKSPPIPRTDRPSSPADRRRRLIQTAVSLQNRRDDANRRRLELEEQRRVRILADVLRSQTQAERLAAIAKAEKQLIWQDRYTMGWSVIMFCALTAREFKRRYQTCIQQTEMYQIRQTAAVAIQGFYRLKKARQRKMKLYRNVRMFRAGAEGYARTMRAIAQAQAGKILKAFLDTTGSSMIAMMRRSLARLRERVLHIQRFWRSMVQRKVGKGMAYAQLWRRVEPDVITEQFLKMFVKAMRADGVHTPDIPAFPVAAPGEPEPEWFHDQLPDWVVDWSLHAFLANRQAEYDDAMAKYQDAQNDHLLQVGLKHSKIRKPRRLSLWPTVGELSDVMLWTHVQWMHGRISVEWNELPAAVRIMHAERSGVSFSSGGGVVSPKALKAPKRGQKNARRSSIIAGQGSTPTRRGSTELGTSTRRGSTEHGRRNSTDRRSSTDHGHRRGSTDEKRGLTPPSNVNQRKSSAISSRRGSAAAPSSRRGSAAAPSSSAARDSLIEVNHVNSVLERASVLSNSAVERASMLSNTPRSALKSAMKRGSGTALEDRADDPYVTSPTNSIGFGEGRSPLNSVGLRRKTSFAVAHVIDIDQSADGMSTKVNHKLNVVEEMQRRSFIFSKDQQEALTTQQDAHGGSSGDSGSDTNSSADSAAGDSFHAEMVSRYSNFNTDRRKSRRESNAQQPMQAIIAMARRMSNTHNVPDFGAGKKLAASAGNAHISLVKRDSIQPPAPAAERTPTGGAVARARRGSMMVAQPMVMKNDS